jgi:hypothetical protein
VIVVVKAEARLYELYKGALERIRQLEALNAALAAQVDRQGKVIEAAIDWADTEYGSDDEDSAAAALVAVVNTYQEQMAQLAKEGRGGQG